jgi:hypothetical protein
MGTIEKVFYALLAAFLVWFWVVLFHYNHKYKVVTKDHISNTLFTDNTFDVGDKVLVMTIEGEYHTYTADYNRKCDTVTVTKVLR